MKQNLILAAAALVALTTACTEKFLTVEHNSARPLETYFTTPEHLEEAVVAAYDPLQWFDWCEGQYNPLNIMSDIMADQIWVGGSDRSDNDYWHMMMNFEATPTKTMSGIWSDAYSGVKRCNDVLTYIGWTKDLSDDAKKLAEAQVRVLRAFYYNILWKFWGNIPYYEVNLTGDFTCEQFKADEVYEKFITDLEGAIALNALPMHWDDANIGRVNKAMAYMLFTEAVMYQNDESRYGKALGYMKEIIADPNYELLPDYGQIFLETGEWSSESIFEISYKDSGAQRSWNWVRGVGGTVLPRMISPNEWSGDGEHDNGWRQVQPALSGYRLLPGEVRGLQSQQCGSRIRRRPQLQQQPPHLPLLRVPAECSGTRSAQQRHRRCRRLAQRRARPFPGWRHRGPLAGEHQAGTPARVCR